MKQAYLLTGKPGVGKTTLIREALSRANKKSGGFYTREIRSHALREGFEIVTLEGATAVLAHVSFESPHRVSKYGVNVESLNHVGVRALRRATAECDLVVIDEIGKMELLSLDFREAVLEALDSGRKVLATIMLSPQPWTDRIKKDSRVKVIQVSRSNHQQVLKEVLAWLNS